MRAEGRERNNGAVIALSLEEEKSVHIQVVAGREMRWELRAGEQRGKKEVLSLP